MRKLILTIVTAIMLVFSSSVVNAASIGGAETQGKGKVAVGLDYEYVFDRDLKDNGSDLDPGEEFKNIELEKLYRVMLKTSYGLLDNLDVYAKIGVADAEASRETYEDGVYEAKTGIFGKENLAYGIGLKGNYELANDWLLGCDLQYVRHKNKFTWKYTPVDDSEETGTGDKKATIQEWHVAPYVAKKLGNFLPYLGVKYSDIKFEGEVGGYKDKYEADDNVGVFLGTDYKIGEHWKFNLEGRFIDETAMSFAATYKF